MQGPGLFRQEALQHQYTSLEDLEKPFQQLRIGAWLPLLALGLLCAAGLTWAIVGRVPETVDGAGILIYPGRVRPIESLVTGRIKQVNVARGGRVKKDDVLVVLDVRELDQQVEQAQSKLNELERADTSQTGLEDLRLDQEKSLRVIQVDALDSSIKDLDRLLVRQEKDGEAAIDEQRKAFERSIEQNRRLNESLRTRAESARRLASSRVVTGEALLAAESALTENNSQLATLEVRLTELTLKETESRQALVTQRSRLADFKVQREQVKVKATQLDQETTIARLTRKFQIQEQSDRFKQLQTTLVQQGQIKSPYDGRVLEAALAIGQPVAPGSALVVLDADVSSGEEDPALRNYAYFPIRSGKRILAGMTVRVSPTSIQRERYGSLIGTVERVSEYPVGARTPAAAVGNPELARTLSSSGGIIEVVIKLEPGETPTGFKWTSAGWSKPLSAGTTTKTTVTIEDRAPITYLLPILRGFLDSSPPETPVSGTEPGPLP